MFAIPNRAAPALAFQLSLGLALWGSLGARAQEIAEPPLFVERTEVVVVNLDVVVTDADGRPVRGLTAADFEVRRGGEPVPIVNFYAVEGAAADAAPERERALGAAQSSDAAVATPPIRPSLIFFFDQTNLAPAHRRQAVRALRDFLAGPAAGAARVAVVAYDRRLTFRWHFLDPGEGAADALEALLDEAPPGERFDLEAQQIKQDLEQQGLTPFDASTFVTRLSSYTDRRLLQVRATFAALREVVDAAAGLAGPKSLVYVGDGLPLRPAEPLAELWSRLFPGARDTGRVQEIAGRGLVTELGELLEAAQRSRVTFYPLYAAPPGMSQHGSAATAVRLPEIPSAHDVGYQSAIDEVAQEPLRSLAVETGGRFAPTPSSWRGMLDGMLTDWRDHYSLGIPPAADPGAATEIDVRVTRPGLVLRHRASVRELDADERLAARTLAALAFGAEENPLGIAIHRRPERTEPDGTFVVPIGVEVPIGRLLLVRKGPYHQGSVTLLAAARDERGRSSQVVRYACPVRIPSAELEVARTRSILCGAQLRMASGEQLLAVSVRDDQSAEEATVRQALSLPARGTG